MNYRDPHENEEPETFQVTAMVDVVFILLAFFVLTVRFTGGERELPVGYEPMSPPTGASTQDLPSEVLVRARPSDDGGVWLAVGETVLKEDGFGELTAVLEHLDLPQLPVVIAADGALSVQQVAAVMDAVLASPMSNLSLARLDAAGDGAERVETGGGDG